MVLTESLLPLLFLDECNRFLFFRLRFLGAAMKTKQTMDVAACDALDHAIEHFAKMHLPA